MLFEGWGTRFPKFSWLCVDGWIQLDLGIASLGDIFCVPCIPYTRLHNQKVLGVYKWEFKYHVGYLSNRHMIRYGIYHMFVPTYSARQIHCFCFGCGIRVASMSSVDSIPSPNGVLILLCEYQSFLIIEIVMSILFNRRVSLQVDPIISTTARSSISSSQRCSFHLSQAAFVFTPSHPFPSRIRIS